MEQGESLGLVRGAGVDQVSFIRLDAAAILAARRQVTLSKGAFDLVDRDGADFSLDAVPLETTSYDCR